MKTHPKVNTKNSDENVSEFDSCTALLLVDLVTDFAFEDGRALWENTGPVIDPIIELKAKARSAGMPVIYVNDNFGNWREDFGRQMQRVMKSSDRGRELVRQIKPEESDFYVLKPQRSGFYETPLDVLLSSLTISSLVIAGITTDICVLFTAHDAYMRGYSVLVPSDCTAAVSDSFKSQALELMERVAKVDVRASTELTILELSDRKK